MSDSMTNRPSIFRYAEFNIERLCQLAGSFRSGLGCYCDVNQHPASGSFNWAVCIIFEDGVQWVLRSPYNGSTVMPLEISMKLLASEATTLRYLKKYSKIPVPEIFSYSPTYENYIGIPYILMSKATGSPLGKTWKPLGSSEPCLPAHIKSKVLSQLGAITFQLSQLRFDKIGSICEENGDLRIGECLSRGHILHRRFEVDDVSRGPFDSELEFMESLITAFMRHAEILPLSHHCFIAPLPNYEDYQSGDDYIKACNLWNDFVTVGSKLDSSENRLDYILVGNALRDIISKLKFDLNTESISFPLSHPDLSANNIYVDDDYNITCIIDWAFTSSVPEAMLLIPPGLPQSRNELTEDLVLAFESGFGAAVSATLPTAVTEYKSKSPVSIPQSRCFWLLARLLSFDSTDDYRLFSGIWREVYGTEKDLEAYFSDQRSLFYEYYNEMQEEDESPESIRHKEQEYFRDNILCDSIARKLTVVSQWKSQCAPSHHGKFRRNGLFVADSRLWKWILKAQEQSP